VYDSADHAPIIGTFDTAHICRQMRLDPCPLFVAAHFGDRERRFHPMVSARFI
jgi:hypothetical protein